MTLVEIPTDAQIDILLKQPNAKALITGLYNDIRMVQLENHKFKTALEESTKKSSAEYDAVFNERNATVTAYQRSTASLKESNREMQKEIFWLKEHHDNLIDKILNRGGSNE